MSVDPRPTTDNDTPAPDRKRRPIRGALSGLLLGLGVLLLLVIYGAAAFTSVTPFILILLACIVVGIAVGLFAPARRKTV